jgi:hypothetical protein
LAAASSKKSKNPNHVKIDDIDTCIETSFKFKHKRKREQNSKVRVETPYPAMTQSEKKSVYVGSAASFQDFVDIFCRTMWENPRGAEIEDALKVLFLGHQTKYGKKIVPDIQLEMLLQKARSLSNNWDRNNEVEPFIKNINSRGWYKIENVVNKYELMIVAIMSLAVFNFSTIKNRHGWSVATEKKQNRLFLLFNDLILD